MGDGSVDLSDLLAAVMAASTKAAQQGQGNEALSSNGGWTVGLIVNPPRPEYTLAATTTSSGSDQPAQINDLSNLANVVRDSVSKFEVLADAKLPAKATDDNLKELLRLDLLTIDEVSAISGVLKLGKSSRPTTLPAPALQDYKDAIFQALAAWLLVINRRGPSRKPVAFFDPTVVQYLTDTLPGSSGAPVFNDDWKLVALHHSGGYLPEPAANSTHFRNEGIRMSAIKADLNARGLRTQVRV